MIWNDQDHGAEHINGCIFVQPQVGLIGRIEDNGCRKKKQNRAEHDDQCQNSFGDANPDRCYAHGETGEDARSRDGDAGELISICGWKRGNARVFVIIEELQTKGQSVSRNPE